jgi:hypothetical protein
MLVEFGMVAIANRKYITMGMLGFAGLILTAGAVVFFGLFGRPEESYPGSSQLTGIENFKLAPFLYFRQEKVYLTQDYMPDVHRWYANRFGMSYDNDGHPNCLSLYTKSIRFWITRVMQVTVCDTINGSMIYDQRSYQFR